MKDGVDGTVLSVDLFATEVVGEGDRLIIIPNQVVVSGVVVNHSRLAARRARAEQGVGTAIVSLKTFARRIVRRNQHDGVNSLDEDEEGDDQQQQQQQQQEQLLTTVAAASQMQQGQTLQQPLLP